MTGKKIADALARCPHELEIPARAEGFTPGPWEVHSEGTFALEVRTALDGDVDSDTGQHTVVGGKLIAAMSDTLEDEANARLIAAAPALYEALEKCALGFDKHARFWRASAERTCLIEDRLRAENAEALAEFARGEAALAAATGTAKTAQQAECEASQSGGSEADETPKGHRP